MRTWFIWLKAPQPLLSFYILYFVCLAGAVIAIMVSAGGNWPLLPVGSAGTLVGLTLLLDINGAAQATAELATKQRPMGIDYSKSTFAKPAAMRLFGAFFGAVSIAMAVAAFQ